MTKYFLLFILLSNMVLASAESIERLSYAGADPAEVLFALYLNSSPGRTADNIVTALEVNLDVISLDDLRLEIAIAARSTSEKEGLAPIHTLWGNTLDVVFNLNDQTLSLPTQSPLDPLQIKKVLQVLKAASKKAEYTYEDVASNLYDAWLKPLTYTQRAVHAWLNQEEIPEYEALQEAYTILSSLDGTYASFEQKELFSHALKTINSEQLEFIMNLTQARALYSEGNRYKEMASRAGITNLKESAADASRLAQAAAIHRILTGTAQETLEEQLMLARKKVRKFEKVERELYQQYLNQNKTRTFISQRSRF